MPQLNASTRPVVLVAEDEFLVRAYAVDMLDELGFDVLEAGDGLEALDLLRSHPDVSLLLSDCRMPLMDGPTLACEAARLRPTLPIVLVTGHTNSCVKAWPVVRKPYRFADLAGALNRVMPELDLVAA